MLSFVSLLQKRSFHHNDTADAVSDRWKPLRARRIGGAFFAVDSFLRLIILCSDVAQHVRNFHRVQYYNNCMVRGERYKTV
jgi:hypothetical protein